MDDVTVAEQVNRAMRAAKLENSNIENLFPFGFTIVGFDVQQMVGRGGQGWVFKAVQRSTGRSVAIKVLMDGRFAESRARRRFEREAKVLASLNHPHIVPLIDQGCTSGGAHYLAMPLIDGVTLDTLFARDRAELLAIVAKVARAVEACHAAGILHRDLKPANILVDEYGHPHVLDFGMARPIGAALAEITRQDCDVGSLLWASPEQLHGGEVGPPTDVYSLGVVLYQCLTNGTLPHSVEGSLSDTLRRILETTPTAPCDDPRLNQIVHRAMSKRPEQRYTSAAAMAEAIEHYRTSTVSATTVRRLTKGAYILALAGAITGACFLLNSLIPSTSTNLMPAMLPMPKMTSGNDIDLVRIPAGDFEMGTRADAPFHQSDEALHHIVIEKPFWIAATETTVRQWRSIMGGSGSFDDGEKPIAGIQFADIEKFCALLTAREGRKYRLPTEAEWEYAARAGGRAPFGWTTIASQVAWYDQNSGKHAHEVAKLAPNGWGLFDMLGNVAEMCSNSRPASDITATDSGDHSAVVSVRGGSFDSNLKDCTVSRRCWAGQGTRVPTIGFRVVSDDQ